MKKLIAILGALGLVATGTTTVISCGQNDNSLVSKIMKEYRI
ncbi:lipoprotein [Mesoplasma melaleucae]|uniref:Lipoprotein n=1 Tax=Mesoplasma melaleucae TaxID=81459 RepID=A0A2K8NZV4_9MOLU|nr:lipoprotein [Mesoplasma melaleucae]ATZ18173.1 hypothetical protein EMELA_v1c06660 [Mesoplasma melaleucae]